jgi:CelD/BcsL family acetyltransferase involved in cellulose biosynthesis
MMRTRIVRDASELQALAPAWRRLLARASHPQPVLTPLWLLTWWRILGEPDGRSLRVLVVEEGGDLVGLVPLSWRSTAHRRAIPVRRVELLATGEQEADEVCSDYVGGLAARGREQDTAAAAARALRDGALGEWDELRMPSMSGEDPLVPKLAEALRAGGVQVAVEPSGECPYIPLPGSWDEYLRALGSSRRYVVTRSLRALDQWAGPGGWRLRRATTREELGEGMRILRALHGERWSTAGRSGAFASERFTRFHEEVMPRMLDGEDGTSLDLMWLVVRQEPIAASYGIVYGGNLQFYQSGRRVDVPRGVRPGIALHALAIRASIEAGRREYDFLAGASRYKRDLALAVRPLVTLRAVAPSLRARAVETVRTFADRAAVSYARAVRATLSRACGVRGTHAGGPGRCAETPAEEPATE